MMNIRQWLDIAENAKKIIDRNRNSIAGRLISNEMRKQEIASAESVLNTALKELVYAGYPAHKDYENGEYLIWLGDNAVTLKAEGELFRRDFKKYREAAGMTDAGTEEEKLQELKPEKAPENWADAALLEGTKAEENAEDGVEDIDLSAEATVSAPEAAEGDKAPADDKIPAEDKETPVEAPEGQTEAIEEQTEKDEEPEKAPAEEPQYTDDLGDDDTRLLTTKKKPEEKKEEQTAPGYTDHLPKGAITFGYHKIAIKQHDSSLSHHAEVIVSPISMDKENPGLVAWISDGLHTEVRVSENVMRPTSKMNTVLLQTADIPIVVGGSVKDGKFESFVKTTKRMEVNGITIEGTAEFYGGNGHLKLEDDGIDIRIVPLSSTNGSTGNAEYFYCILEKGKDPVCGDNIKEKNVLFEYKGQKMELVAKWSNEVLYSTARPL